MLLAGRKRSARVDERAARQREAEEREVVLRVEREEREKEEKEEKHRREEEEVCISSFFLSSMKNLDQCTKPVEDSYSQT